MFLPAGGAVFFVLFRRKGLWFWKKPLFFLSTCFSGEAAGGAACFTGLGGSILEKEVGLEYSLRESLLEGLAEFRPERSEGGPVRHSMVMPSMG